MVSIIIPVYNVEKYIINCLNSFENQNHKDFEIILVNDGSKDNSAALILDYIKNSKMNIRLINQDNSGVSAARNKGIVNAIGEYICFVDSDDMVAPEYISEMYNAIREHNYDIVFCGVRFVSQECDSNLISYEKQPSEEMKSYEALERFLLRDISPGVWSLMVKSSVIKYNKLFFSEGFRYSEDIEFIFKMLVHAEKILNIRNPLYLYRIRESSAMSLVDYSRLDGYNLMKNLEAYFDIENPDFAVLFRKYGVARWVWATVWQTASVSRNCKEFKNNTKLYNPKQNMKALLSFPKRKVSISALIYLISPFLYYNLVRRLINKNNERKMVSLKS